MGVNTVTNNAAGAAYAYQANNGTQTKTEEKATETKTAATDQAAAVYEPSQTAKGKASVYKPDNETIARLKAENDKQKANLIDMVRKMLADQGGAQGKADSVWNLLREGKLTVDAATRDQAIKDISEDGYWGVKQTSQRILDFATALTGGDPDKIEEMRAAFEKGFKMAEKAWGGKLPDISQKTRDAVLAGFDKMKEDAAAAKVNK